MKRIQFLSAILATAVSAGSGQAQSVLADGRTTLQRIVQDQKTDFVKFPSAAAHGKHWLPVLAISAATAGLIVADKHDASYFRSTTQFHGFNSAFSGTATAAGVIAAPAVLYAFERFEEDSYAKESGLLATEAAVDAEVVGEVLKFTTERSRPETMGLHANYGDSFWQSKDKLNPGFPSSHSVGAFAVATVLSDRYGRRHRWTPFVSYGLAAAVGFSRATSSAHYPSDVFLGAALGYAIAHFTVMGGSAAER